MSYVAEKDALRSKSIGYRHLSREDERKMLSEVLCGDTSRLDQLSVEKINNNPLAAEPIRSLKNNVICMITLFGRAAIDEGAESEHCFAVGDSYINRLEGMQDPGAIRQLTVDMICHYVRLVQNSRIKNYSLPVLRAIRYIYAHLFEELSLQQIASHLGLHANYLSSLFSREVGVTCMQYIRKLKVEEAKKLLQEGGSSITEIAGMLGYTSVSYFSKEFHRQTGAAPSKFQQSAN